MHDHKQQNTKPHGHTSEEARDAGKESSKPLEDYAIEAGRGSATGSKGGHKADRNSEVMHPIADGDTNDDDVSQRDGFKE